MADSVVMHYQARALARYSARSALRYAPRCGRGTAPGSEGRGASLPPMRTSGWRAHTLFDDTGCDDFAKPMLESRSPTSYEQDENNDRICTTLHGKLERAQISLDGDGQVVATSEDLVHWFESAGEHARWAVFVVDLRVD